jgi:hypothetical protein
VSTKNAKHLPVFGKVFPKPRPERSAFAPSKSAINGENQQNISLDTANH